MPQPIASPTVEPSTGVITAASPGPSSCTPTSGLRTVPPCTSWSYCRTIHSLLQTLYEDRMRNRSSVKVPPPPPTSPPPRGEGRRFLPPLSPVGEGPGVGGAHTACR